jgi:WD40 repeat protein/tRNA A-37 threonylcarbamoyl transferase component Bud32
MNLPTASTQDLLDPSQLAFIDELCDRFEAAWPAPGSDSPRPRIEEFLGDLRDPSRSKLLRELLALEVAYRREAGENPTPEEYQHRFPEHAGLMIAWTSDKLTHSSSGSFNASAAPSIPGYEILEKLGEGGMGVVYKARHVKLNRLVALKMIRGSELAGEQALARFHLEAEAVARLQHPNIVQIYEVGETASGPYFSLEFVEGCSLARKTDGTPLPARQAAELMEVLGRAVQAAHEQRILHRDLKPQNVLLTAAGTPKLTDFGLAKWLDRERAQTQTGAVLGTPGYIAPEQAEGRSNQVGPGADIYSLGAILYELLTGRPPFKAETPLDTVLQVLSEEPVSPRSLNGRVPRDLETICLRCLQKDARKRYASAEQLADDLKRFVEGRPIVARPVGQVERLGRWCRRKPALASAIGLAAAAVIATLGVSIAFALYQKTATDALRHEQKKTETALVEARHQAAEAKLQTGIQMLERGLTLCELHQATTGLHWLARALKEVPEGHDPLQQTIRWNIANWALHLHALDGILACQGEVRAVAFSPDGETVLTGSAANSAQLWSVKTGQPVGSPLKHSGPVDAVTFSSDGRLALTGSADRTARLWSVPTGQPVGPALEHRKAIRAVAFAPDGRVAVTASADGTARLWSVETGLPLAVPLKHSGAVSAATFSPDGQLVLTGSADRTASVWSVQTGKRLGPPLRHEGGVNAVVISPDGQTALTASPDKTARFWSVKIGEQLGSPMQHQHNVVAVAFSPDGKTALTGSFDRTARLWSVPTGLPLGPPLRHQNVVRSVAFSPDGRIALTGSFDRTARLWSVQTCQPLGPPLHHAGSVLTVAFSPDGRTAITGSDDNMARLWSVQVGQSLGLPLLHENVLRAVAFSPDGRTAVTASEDHTTRFWSVQTGEPVKPALEHEADVVSMIMSPDGQMLLSGCENGVARLWSVKTGQPLGLPLRQRGSVEALAFSPDAQTALTAGKDGMAYLWNVNTGHALGPPLQHRSWVRRATFSPDGKVILTGCNDGTIRIWDFKTGQVVGKPMRHHKAVRAIAFSPDGRLILTASEDKSAQLWSVESCRPVGPPLRHHASVVDVAFSPDGQMALTGSDDNTARLWSVKSGQPLGPPLQHQDWVSAVAFSRDGTMVSTGSKDNTARLWSAQTYRAIGPPLWHHNWVRQVAFCPDCRRVLTGSTDKTGRLWHIQQLPNGGPEEITLWLTVNTGLKLDDNGAIQILAKDALRQSQKCLEQLGSPLSSLKPWACEDSTWHASQAVEALQENDLFAASWHLDRIPVNHPNHDALWRALERTRAVWSQEIERIRR